jgi:hypothetical protein
VFLERKLWSFPQRSRKNCISFSLSHYRLSSKS